MPFFYGLTEQDPYHEHVMEWDDAVKFAFKERLALIVQFKISSITYGDGEWYSTDDQPEDCHWRRP